LATTVNQGADNGFISHPYYFMW